MRKFGNLLNSVGFLLAAVVSTSALFASEADKLQKVTSDYLEGNKHLDAYNSTYFEVPEDHSKFGDYLSPAYEKRYQDLINQAATGLATIDPAQLAPNDLLGYELLKSDVDSAAAALQYDTEPLDFNQMGNRLQGYLDDASADRGMFPFATVQDYDDFVKRSEGFAAYVDNQIATLRRGITTGFVLPCPLIAKTRETFAAGLEPDVQKNPFYGPVTRLPTTFAPNEQQRLRDAYQTMVAQNILPNYERFAKFYDDEYSPRCRATYGYGALPHGKEIYALKISSNTNVSDPASVLHQKGLDEVARIRAALTGVQADLHIPGTFTDFLQKMSTDPAMFFASKDEELAAFATVKQSIADKIDNFFSLKPKADFKIVEAGTADAPSGEYNEPSVDFPFGRFYLNTLNLKAAPRYEVTTLLMHETVPGHHLQLALKFEMKDSLSEYQRKVFNSTSFVEGWALYSEHLGYEMGMYTDTLQKFGNLNDDMLRAVRLVVDTGIHDLNWTRDEVLAYMKANLAQGDQDRESEADRYAAIPGQALAYKVGQLKILELRQKAESELGAKFDVKEFHRVVVGSGTISLGVLERLVNEWIQKVKQG